MDLDGGFCGPYVFEAIVGANCDGVFARDQSVHGEGVGFGLVIADAVRRAH